MFLVWHTEPTSLVRLSWITRKFLKMERETNLVDPVTTTHPKIRGGGDHVTTGPMRGLEKNCMGRGQTTHRRSLQLLDQLCPEGWVGDELVKTHIKNLSITNIDKGRGIKGGRMKLLLIQSIKYFTEINFIFWQHQCIV